jgi:hypothetical protein
MRWETFSCQHLALSASITLLLGSIPDLPPTEQRKKENKKKAKARPINLFPFSHIRNSHSCFAKALSFFLTCILGHDIDGISSFKMYRWAHSP